jgi:hypothetical protein
MSEQVAEVFTSLPPVAKSIFVFCKKCDADRYQTVLAHSTATSAKIQCEVCKAKSTFKLPKAKKPAGEKKSPTGAALKRKTASATAKKNAHMDEYNNLAATAKGDTHNYSMKAKFSMNQILSHPKFGMGYVRSTQVDKIEVVFEDEVRMLVHNRQ